jgi:antitoxin VapB
MWPMLRHMPKTAPVVRKRRVRIFKNGRNQAVRIPREFELPVGDAIMRKEGDCIIIEPARSNSLLEVLAKLGPLKEDFPRIKRLPTRRVKI